MRRGLLILLTLLMLAQSTWAAVAVCCLDELRNAESEVQLHFQAVSDADAAQAASSGGETLKHACDVSHCHCHHASVATGEELHLGFGEAVRFAIYEQMPVPAKSHIPEGLDRPNWQRA